MNIDIVNRIYQKIIISEMKNAYTLTYDDALMFIGTRAVVLDLCRVLNTPLVINVASTSIIKQHIR